MPDWLVLVSTAFGIMVAAFVTRMGWKSSAPKEQAASHGGQSYHLDAALVDSASINRLTASIEACTLELMTSRELMKAANEKKLDATHKLSRMIENTANELTELRREIRDTSNAIGRR